MGIPFNINVDILHVNPAEKGCESVQVKIIIDADATPRQVMKICERAANDFSVNLVTVASFNHRICSDCHITVSDAPQAADIKVVNLVENGDIVVTQDWGLAALVSAKGAAVLTPKGRVFREQEISFLLEERELKSRVRRSGRRTKGPKKRSFADDERFEKSLYCQLGKLLREQH